MSDPLFKVVDLTIGWDETVVQKDATFEIERGEIFAILGGSGCGKSTLLRYLVGLETPIGGSITIDGVAPDQSVPGRPLFGVMFQSGALLGSFTVGENVALPLLLAAFTVVRPTPLPEPPLPATFDRASAVTLTRDLAREYPDRSPGSAGAAGAVRGSYAADPLRPRPSPRRRHDVLLAWPAHLPRLPG